MAAKRQQVHHRRYPEKLYTPACCRICCVKNRSTEVARQWRLAAPNASSRPLGQTQTSRPDTRARSSSQALAEFALGMRLDDRLSNDVSFWPCPMSHLMSLSGAKRTCRFALHMSAFDPKRTLAPFQYADVSQYGALSRASEEAMRRREIIKVIAASVAAWPIAARAQQAPIPVVGFINAAS